MHFFSADPTMFSKKNQTNFVPMKTLKNGPQKSPEFIFHIINMSQDSSVSLSGEDRSL